MYVNLIAVEMIMQHKSNTNNNYKTLNFDNVILYKINNQHKDRGNEKNIMLLDLLCNEVCYKFIVISQISQ